jgi:ferredoxin-thioredoxin reductase catalytic subunit/glutaredoxin
MAQKIQLYALSTCAYCQAIGKMFHDLKIEHDYIEVDLLEGDERTSVLDKLKEMNPKKSFPTTVIGDTVITGYKVQEIKEVIGVRTEVDEMFDRLRKVNEKKGYYFNRNKELTFDLIRGLLTNKARYGYMACPCRLASGQREKDKDILCPCDYREPDVAEFGSCFCGLYVSHAWNNDEIEHSEVPERRPPELM